MRWKIKYGVLIAVVCVDWFNEVDIIWCCRNFLGFGNNYVCYILVWDKVVIFINVCFMFEFNI